MERKVTVVILIYGVEKYLRHLDSVVNQSCKAFVDYLFNFQALNKVKSILGVPYCGYYYRQTVKGNAFSRGFNFE